MLVFELLKLQDFFSLSSFINNIYIFCPPYGISEVECWADFNKRIFPIIIGATVVGLLLIAVLTFLIIWNNRRQAGYDRIWEDFMQT